MIEVKVEQVMFDPSSNVPVVFLKEIKGSGIIPIWIGPMEASAILLEMEKVKSPRPMTHDLFLNFCEQNNIRLEMILISDLKEGTYYAKLFYQTKWKKRFLDCRPSDAIAIGLRAKIPIYVEEKVMSCSQGINKLGGKNTEKYYRDYLESLSKDDFENKVM